MCVHSGITLGLLGDYFEFIRGWVHFTHWSVQQTRLFSYHLIACNPHPLYIPNTHVVSTFRGLLLIEVYSLCPLWVYSVFYIGFTMGLPWVCSCKPGVNLEQTPKVNPCTCNYYKNQKTPIYKYSIEEIFYTKRVLS